MPIRTTESPLYFDAGGGTITSSTDATPIVVTAAAAHGLRIGDKVWITGHGTNTNANGIHTVVSVPTTTTFGLSGTSGNGGGAGSGGSYYYGAFENGMCELRIRGIRVVNTSASGFTIELWDGPSAQVGGSGTTSEFSGAAATFDSIDTTTNSVLLTGAGATAVAGRNLDGRIFTNNSQTPQIVAKNGPRLFLTSTAGLDEDAAWSIDGQKLDEIRVTATGNARYDYSFEGDVCWNGLWIKGPAADVEVWFDLGEGSWYIPRRINGGTVGNTIGNGQNRIKLA